MKIQNIHNFILPLYCSILALALTGCVSVNTLNTVQPIVDTVSAANQKAAADRLVHPSPLFESKAMCPLTADAQVETVRLVTQQLQDAGLYKVAAVQKIVSAASSGQTLKLNNWEIQGLAKTLLKTMHTKAFNGSSNTFNVYWHNYAQGLSMKSPLAIENSKPAPDVVTLFEAYYLAYANGQFTLRDGTILGKPTGSISYTNGNFKGAIPNDTVDGIVTVFTEALSDCLLPTPLFYESTTNQTYVSYYDSVTNIFPITTSSTNYQPAYVQLYRSTNTITKDYFLNGKIPTATAFLHCYEVVSKDEKGKDKPGLTQEEVQFIRAVSGLTAKQSQALGTLIFQTWGGGSAGQFVFLHISVGNNQVLSSIVQNLLSSFSYHATEKPLTTVFWNYDGKNDSVNALLDHYEDLIAIISKAAQ